MSIKPTFCLLFVILATGCVQTRQSEPKRTAVEQLLLSRAADHALSVAELAPLRERKVYVDPQYFDSEDAKYVIGTVRDAISQAGGLLVDKPEDAELIAEPRSGALSIDSGDSLVGLPQLPFPIPFTGTIQSPEVPFYKAQRQFSVAKIAMLVLDAKTRKHVFSTGVLLGKSHHHYYTFLGFFRWISTDLPAKQ
tara:strand:+ start:3683 stop:4264 length:582 start_codon:yes stop_codon:yes gene_type:complete